MNELDCLAYLSRDEDTETAYVFIHGFNGNYDPTQTKNEADKAKGGGTWRGFQDLARSQKAFWKSDLYFLGYHSVLGDTHLNAARILDFLQKQLACTTARDGRRIIRHVNDAAQTVRGRYREDPLPYSELKIIAHSAGAVVARKAIVRAQRQNGLPAHAQAVNTLLLNAELMLFAPAQGGTRAVGAVEFIESLPLIGRFAKAGRESSPAFYDLTSGSLGLDQVRSDTEAMQGVHPGCSTRTMWAEYDKVVEAVDYSSDDASRFMRGSTHTQVCKPDDGRREAILAFLFPNDGWVTGQVLGA